jgi:hypothetical protein
MRVQNSSFLFGGGLPEKFFRFGFDKEGKV